MKENLSLRKKFFKCLSAYSRLHNPFWYSYAILADVFFVIFLVHKISPFENFILTLDFDKSSMLMLGSLAVTANLSLFYEIHQRINAINDKTNNFSKRDWFNEFYHGVIVCYAFLACYLAEVNVIAIYFVISPLFSYSLQKVLNFSRRVEISLSWVKVKK